MLHAFMFTLSGVPVLYSGDEVAQENDSAYHQDPLKADDSRYLHRGNMDWVRAEKRTEEGSHIKAVFDGIKALEKCYGEYPVFDAAADTWLLETGNDHVLGIGRYYQGQKLLALFNFSDMTQSVWMHENERYTDLMDGTEKSAEYIRMASGSFLWLLLDYQK